MVASSAVAAMKRQQRVDVHVAHAVTVGHKERAIAQVLATRRMRAPLFVRKPVSASVMRQPASPAVR